MDPQCLNSSCAHAQGVVLESTIATTTNRWGTPVEKEIVTKRGGPVMECPTRFCSCSKGKSLCRRCSGSGSIMRQRDEPDGELVLYVGDCSACGATGKRQLPPRYV